MGVVGNRRVFVERANVVVTSAAAAAAAAASEEFGK